MEKTDDEGGLAPDIDAPIRGAIVQDARSTQPGQDLHAGELATSTVLYALSGYANSLLIQFPHSPMHGDLNHPLKQGPLSPPLSLRVTLSRTRVPQSTTTTQGSTATDRHYARDSL